jgi:hypothetical protein
VRVFRPVVERPFVWHLWEVRRGFVDFSFALLALALAVGCGVAPPSGLAAHSTTLPLSGPCPEDAQGGMEFTDEVSSLRVEITGPGINAPVVGEGSVTTLSIDGVPAGDSRRVRVLGLGSSGAPVWRGFRRDVSVRAGEDVALDVLLARVADLSCPRTPQRERRTFHSATVLNDGRVLLVGGARSEADAANTCGAGCTLLDATGSAELYDPTTGRFSDAGLLAVPRLLHQATLLEDGRVAISGGTIEALTVPVSAENPLPLKPRLSAISLVEIWDPASNGFVASAAVDDPNGPRIFHAAALTSDGNLLLTGGIPGPAPIHDLSNALSQTTLCNKSSLQCVAGPPMASPRAGHGIVSFDDGTVLVWGGSVSSAQGAFRPEILRSGENAFRSASTAGFNDPRFNLFFAATTRYVGFRALAAGGLVRGADGTFSLSAIDKGGVARGPVYVFDYDAAQRPEGALSAGPYVDDVLDALALQAPTFFGAAAPLPGGRRAVLAGGFSSLAMTPSDRLDIYDEDPFRVAPLSVGGEVRSLREGRAGLTASGVGDGTVLFAGGSTDSGGGRVPRVTAEVFADSNDPGGAQ